jgi:IS4 transposase
LASVGRSGSRAVGNSRVMANVAALRRRSGRLLKWVGREYRVHVRRLAEQRGCWRVAGWLAFGADSTRHDAPMTAANERTLGTASRDKSWPQLLLTTVFHPGSGLPWSFLRGRARSGERRHLLGLLGTLPADALLVADAGFVGYDFWDRVVRSGRSFLIRVGSNVRLVEGVHLQCRGDHVVWVWPDQQQKRRRRPLVLRLITLTDSRNRTMHLPTDVLERDRLDDAAATELYGLRWGVEVMCRSLKQTLGRRKLLSDSPRNARVELSWAMVGLWTLALVKAERCPRALPPTRGGAAVLRVLRQAMAGVTPDVIGELARLKADTYERTGSKKSRHWPHKKKERPPGKPKARSVTAAELALAEELARLERAA